MNYFKSLLFGFYLCFFCQFIFCNSKNGKPEDSLYDRETEIPFDTTVFITRDSSMNAIVKLLNLGDIRNKSNKEEVRIWYNGISDTGKIIVIKNDELWHSSNYLYKAKKFDKNYNVVSLEKTVKENEPASGWDFFLSNLIDSGIYKLKNYKEISDYYLCNDGDQINIEIWRDNSYTIYEYPCFLLYKDKLEEVMKVRDICLLIEREFGYNLLPTER